MNAPRRPKVLIVASLLGSALVMALVTAWSVLWPMWQDRAVGRAMERAILTGNPGTINDAVNDAKRIRGGAGAVPLLARWLRDGDEDVRMACAFGICELGPAAEDAVAALIEAMADENSEVCRRSTVSLGKIGRPAISQLIRGLTSENRQVRGWCAEALGEIGPDARPAIDALVALAINANEPDSVRRDALLALPFIDLQDDRARTTIFHALEHGSDEDRYRLSLTLSRRQQHLQFLQACFLRENVNVRATAVHSLGYMSWVGEDVPLRQELIEALDDPAPLVRSAALTHLGCAGEAHHSAFAERKNSVLAAVEMRLNDPDSLVRTAAARAVWQIENRADRAVPILIEALQDPSNVNRGLAAQTLSEIGDEAKRGTDAMIAALRHKPTHDQGDDRWHIAFALSSLDPGHKEVATALVELFSDESAAKRAMIANALGQLGSEASDAIPALAKCLGQSDTELRRAAARALGQIGVPARSAIPALRDALDDRDAKVSSEARDAIERVLAPED